MLGLLTYLRRASETPHDALEGWHCIYVQHVLESNLDCIDFLISFGLKIEHLTVFGKSYSTCKSVLDNARSRGIDIRTSDEHYFFDRHFDAHIIDAVTERLEELDASAVEKVLLIDEGGIAARAYATLSAARSFRLSVVELTARGTQYYGGILDAPVVDVAGSHVKKNVESQVIARSMLDHLTEVLFTSGLGLISQMRVGLLGTGAIGAAIISECENRGLRFLYSDLNPKRPRNCLPSSLKGLDLILSSTGAGVDWGALASGPRTLFANCGSSDVEFNLWRTRAPMSKTGDLLPEFSGEPWKGKVLFRDNDLECVFLRGGFPINFDGSKDPIPPREISITRSLLMAGALQSVRTLVVGVQALDLTLQKKLVYEYERLLNGAD